MQGLFSGTFCIQKTVCKNTGKIVPIYSTTKSLSENAIRQAVENALKLAKEELKDNLPEYIKKEYNLENFE